MQALLSLILGVLALVSGMYFINEYGMRSPALIVSALSMLFAIIFAFNGGEQYGRSKQQEDMIEAMNKQQEVIVAQMNEFDAKHRAKASSEGR